jgi:hypothetical protein
MVQFEEDSYQGMPSEAAEKLGNEGSNVEERRFSVTQ